MPTKLEVNYTDIEIPPFNNSCDKCTNWVINNGSCTHVTPNSDETPETAFVPMGLCDAFVGV